MGVIALDSVGRWLFSLDAGATTAFTVDERTGNVWCLRGEWADDKGTLVYDPAGRLVATHPWSGDDIAYNRFDESLWIVGAGALKADRQGQVLARGPGASTRWSRVDPDHRDGSVWIVGTEWDKSWTPSSRVLRLDAGATLVHRIEYPRERLFDLACDPETGVLWLVRDSGPVERILPDGKSLPALPIATVALAFSERTGLVWVATRDKLLALDREGRVAGEHAWVPQGAVFRMAAP